MTLPTTSQNDLDPPTERQVRNAYPHLDQAAKIATVFALGKPAHSGISRGFLIDNAQRAAAALGYRLEPITPRLAVDNTPSTEPNVMREAQ
jgi:hypothetical protein